MKYILSFPQDDPVCMCEVVLAGEAMTNCMVNGSIATFTIGYPFFNQFVIVEITLHSAALTSTSSVNISKSNMTNFTHSNTHYSGTHDVNHIVAVSEEPNSVNLSACLVEGSPALGVLFMLLVDSNVTENVNYTGPVFLVLNRTMAGGFWQTNITQGHYTVLAFDVERNGEVKLGTSSPAAVERVTVVGQGEQC